MCRVCRSEGSPEKPLFHPCVCAGSIKYIHQDWYANYCSHFCYLVWLLFWSIIWLFSVYSEFFILHMLWSNVSDNFCIIDYRDHLTFVMCTLPYVLTSCVLGDTICLCPMQIDSIFIFIRQLAPVLACWLFKTSAKSWLLIFWPWKWCSNHVWHGLSLCQF